MAFEFEVLRIAANPADPEKPLTTVLLVFDPPYATGHERAGYETCGSDTWTVPLPKTAAAQRKELARLFVNAGIA